MFCKKCGKEFAEDYRKYPKGEPGFCSRKCSNSRRWTKEDKEKKSISAKKSEKVKLVNSFRNSDELRETLHLANVKFKEKMLDDLLNANYEDLKFGRLRKRVILEQSEKCNICGVGEWNGKFLSLELEHKDGNHYNNERNNLEALCPNCHSQTKYWRGRNVRDKSNKKKIKDEELVEAFIEEGNIRKALIKVGMASKGANYGRVKKALSLRGIDYNGRVSDSGNPPDF